MTLKKLRFAISDTVMVSLDKETAFDRCVVFLIPIITPANPNGEPDVIPLSDSAQFRTFCDVPSRAGHHVIYGEWGRTPPTKERFHGCIDIMMDGEPVDPFVPAARIRLDPRGNDFIGSGSISLDASSSSGGELSYTWSFSSEGEDGVYTLSDSTSSTATLFLADPSAVQRVTVSLTVTNTEGSSTTHSIILHIPSSIGSIWQDFGPVADGGYTPLDVGTSGTYQIQYQKVQTQKQDALTNFGILVSILTVDVNGAEVYYPSPPLVVDGSNNGMWNWPVSLSQSLSGSPVAVGVLDPTTEQITPQYSNTANRIYAHVGYGFTLAQTTFNGAGNPLPPPTSAPVDSPPSPMPVDPPTGSPVVVADPPTAAPVVPMDPPSAAPVASPPSGGGPGVEPSCVVHVRSDINPWHGGMDIGFDVNSVILDFTNTGLDLSLVSVQQGSFTSLTINGNKMTVVKPSWASSTTLVYLGMGGNNVPGLGSFTAPACLTA